MTSATESSAPPIPSSTSTTSPSSSDLTPSQSAALFDILSHRALYDEIVAFKNPAALDSYGPPFQPSITENSCTSPILQTLLSRFILKLPGMRDVDSDFWRIRIKTLISNLAAAELSESYDKGVLGIRKTVSTAISALVEYPARGVLGGLPKNEEALAKEARSYDVGKAEDVSRAFQDFVQRLVYGDMWEELFTKTAETDQLREQSSLVQAAHEYIVLNLASFMHYTLVLSPEGPSLLRMVENIHKLIPYMLVRQTLKIGNVATMISGMVRLVLAKMSVSSITNWMGLSNNADEGMNLLQQIINQVLGWDKRDLKKRLDKVERDKDVPSKEVRKALDTWIQGSKEEHEETRRQSQEQDMSIVATILSLSSTDGDIPRAQHDNALEYLALQLAIRDRTEIVRVLCKSNPDQLTQGIREAVAAYEPIIRRVHEAVDLGGTVWDFEQFVNDMVKMSKASRKDGNPPSVEDYVKLLHTHQDSVHRFLHQVAKNGAEVTAWFKEYCTGATNNFKAKDGPEKRQVKDELKTSFTNLTAEEQSNVREELQVYAKYLESLHASSASRIQDVIANKTATAYGPGAYLARWQELLDSTKITPDQAKGEVRSGRTKSVQAEARKDAEGKKLECNVDIQEESKVESDKTPDWPVMAKTTQLLLPQFRQTLLAQTTTKGLEV